jgi:hypothetical protein
MNRNGTKILYEDINAVVVGSFTGGMAPIGVAGSRSRL